ncbi:MAG: hypothetical protein K0Q74_1281 [Gammaproteobacteria bacterium]|jgi:hypothetical protein|nr:hypothetical protein [Gammaproteobacteria bacterium]
MKKTISAALISATFLLSGCAAIVETPQARNNVIASPNPPPKSCKYVQQVIGNQGNFFTGGWTSNQNLELGAMNDLKNKTAALGANYVQITTNRAGNTGSFGYSNYGGMTQASGSMQQTNVTNMGNAYRCPPQDIGF